MVRHSRAYWRDTSANQYKALERNEYVGACSSFFMKKSINFFTKYIVFVKKMSI